MCQSFTSKAIGSPADDYATLLTEGFCRLINFDKLENIPSPLEGCWPNWTDARLSWSRTNGTKDKNIPKSLKWNSINETLSPYNFIMMNCEYCTSIDRTINGGEERLIGKYVAKRFCHQHRDSQDSQYWLVYLRIIGAGISLIKTLSEMSLDIDTAALSWSRSHKRQ